MLSRSNLIKNQNEIEKQTASFSRQSGQSKEELGFFFGFFSSTLCL